MALALPTSTLYTGIDSTVTYSRLGSTIQTVNSGGVVALSTSGAPANKVVEGKPPRCGADVSLEMFRRGYNTPRCQSHRDEPRVEKRSFHHFPRFEPVIILE